METKLYVGNLVYSVTEDDLRTLFTQAGTVSSASVIKDRATGRSKGFGFVEMSSQAEAEKAISMFNGVPFQERALTVNLARAREERPRDRFDRGSGGSGGGGGGRSGGGRSRGSGGGGGGGGRYR